MLSCIHGRSVPLSRSLATAGLVWVCKQQGSVGIQYLLMMDGSQSCALVGMGTTNSH